MALGHGHVTTLGGFMETTVKKNYFERDESFYPKTRDTCKWENDEFEEEPGDGGAPCKRCTLWDGRE